MSEQTERRTLLTIDEAAEYLHVPARWVADAVRQRKVRCTRIGKHVRFRMEHLDELIASGEQPVTATQPLSAASTPPRRGSGRSKL
ncbi:helix-turn-helix domain-containing protein [Pimelobacter simplex]|uniref:helix-turn-helix domain-containing protein n=1 Tax=Nocardioides simplex TaxID=2045 RepID=UPI0019339019|nr:helix-turn-helix domain-containing protein [Pimelobacter simplex]